MCTTKNKKYAAIGCRLHG